MEDTVWHYVNKLNDSVEGHALIWRNIWCPTDSKGRIAIYKKNSLIGNKDKRIAERLLSLNTEANRIQLFPLVILPDSPSNYY